MVYQVIQHLKTKSKVLGVVDTPEQARNLLLTIGARFSEINYYGGFPIWVDGYKKYSVQGKNEEFGIVCSLDDKAVAVLS